METTSPFTFRGAISGARQALPVAASVFAVGIAFGVLARQVGLSLVESIAMSALVFAGASQFIALGLWAASLPIATIVVTTLIVNLRHVLMGAALQPWFRDLPRRRRYLSVFFMVDESWALTMRRVADGESDRAFLIGAGGLLFISWNSATIIGRTAGSVLPHPERIGLDFAITAVFIALLAGLWRGRADLAPWLVAAAAAIAASRWLPGTWYIVVGALAGTVGGGIRGER